MTNPPPSLKMIRRFDAAPERVFDAWTDPALVSRWLFTSPGSERHDAVLDVRVGGTWRITDVRGGKEYVANGEYLEIDRPRRLVFTFSMPQFSPNSDKITVELERAGSGCVMTFVQEGVDIADELRKLPSNVEGGSEQGWRAMFVGLAAAIDAKVETPDDGVSRTPKRMMVLYKVKPDRVTDNEAQIANVFAELERERLPGVEYAAFKLADGVSFLHVSTEHPGARSLLELASFQGFLGGFWDRCAEPAMPVGLTLLGAYSPTGHTHAD